MSDVTNPSAPSDPLTEPQEPTPQVDKKRSSTLALKIAITAGAILVAAAHTIWPDVQIDPVTVALILVALLPWLAPIVKSVEITGLGKVELQEVKSASQEIILTYLMNRIVEMDSALQEAIRTRDVSTAADFLRIRELVRMAREATPLTIRIGEPVVTLWDQARDPNLVLIGLRANIANRLAKMAELQGIDPHRQSIGSLLNELIRANAIDQRTARGVSELVSLANSAIHGATVAPAVGSYLLDSAPLVLEALDTLAAQQQVRLGHEAGGTAGLTPK